MPKLFLAHGRPHFEGSSAELCAILLELQRHGLVDPRDCPVEEAPQRGEALRREDGNMTEKSDKHCQQPPAPAPEGVGTTQPSGEPGPTDTLRTFWGLMSPGQREFVLALTDEGVAKDELDERFPHRPTTASCIDGLRPKLKAVGWTIGDVLTSEYRGTGSDRMLYYRRGPRLRGVDLSSLSRSVSSAAPVPHPPALGTDEKWNLLLGRLTEPGISSNLAKTMVLVKELRPTLPELKDKLEMPDTGSTSALITVLGKLIAGVGLERDDVIKIVRKGPKGRRVIRYVPGVETERRSVDVLRQAFEAPRRQRRTETNGRSGAAPRKEGMALS